MSSTRALKREVTMLRKALSPKPEDGWTKRSQEISLLLRQEQEQNEYLRATSTDQEFCLLQLQTYRDVLCAFYPKEQVDALIQITTKGD